MPGIFVYRDLVGARSEGFIQRQYRAFKQLDVLFVGTKRGPLAPRNSLILAASGGLGSIARTRFRQFASLPRKLRQAIEKDKPALIHAQFGLGGALALPIACAANIPLVVTFHGGDATKDKHFRSRPIIPTIFQRRREAMVDYAETILCVSHYVRDRLLERGFPAGKLRTHYLGIDIPNEVALPPLGVANTVLFVGRLVEKKGVDILIDAMALARETCSELTLTVVGDGPLRADLQRKATAAEVPTDFQGWLNPQAVQNAIRRAVMLAVPSRTAAGGDAEGLPTVIMEAMALGVPVVASRHAGIPEIVSHNVTGLLVPESDPAALAKAIVSIQRDQELAARLRAEAYADVRARFDAERQSAQLEQYLLEVIATRSKTA